MYYCKGSLLGNKLQRLHVLQKGDQYIFIKKLIDLLYPSLLQVDLIGPLLKTPLAS